MLGALLTIAALGATPSIAAASRPVVVALNVTPHSLPSGGGVITVTGRVRNAATCTVYDDVSPVTVGCSSGRFKVRRRLPRNTGKYPDLYLPYVVAHGDGRNSRSRDGEVHVEPPPTAVAPAPTAAAPRVVGLDACSPGPECDYGAAYETFENWGNTAPEDFGDCTFAAAANWEQILFHWRAYPTLIGYEFAEAGGSAATGLPQASLWRYWEKYDIAGSYLTGLHSYATTPENVRNGVRDYAAMIVELRFGEGWAFAQYKAAAGLHDAVVAGFTPDGPLVVTWGETVQMTWEQWSDEAVGMWGIGATNPNPTS
jgi:hypothetical protein